MTHRDFQGQQVLRLTHIAVLMNSQGLSGSYSDSCGLIGTQRDSEVLSGNYMDSWGLTGTYRDSTKTDRDSRGTQEGLTGTP